jgi:NAD(P)-dependent dehydrogenase (short-subunit alcohol dehydrogenase family)
MAAARADHMCSLRPLLSQFVDTIDFSLNGQVAIVTGASRGIGHDLALALAGAGAVVVAAARAAHDGAGLVDEVRSMGADAVALELDLSDVASSRRAVERLVADTGHVDILVNNAGLGFNHDAIDVTEADWDSMMDVNLKGLFFITQAVARPMIQRGYGRIISLSSQAGLVGIRRHAVYSASKGGVNMLTRVLALEWAPHGITVNAIAPTFIRTPGTAERLDDPEFAADVLSRIPVGRFGTTADVAAAMLYLASPAAGLVTGTVLPVDGGWTAQ